MNNYGILKMQLLQLRNGRRRKIYINPSACDKLNFRTSFENVDHNPYLDKFYNDFERWSFHLQIYF